MPRHIKKVIRLKEQVSGHPYLFEPTEDPIQPFDELDIDIANEFPEIETEEENAQIMDEEEAVRVEYEELPLNYASLPPYAATYEENYRRHCSLEK